MTHLNEVKLYQESNREGELIAPFTPEHAIYDTEGVRLDVKLKGLDIAKIKALLAKFSGGGNGISAIIEVTTDEDDFISKLKETMNSANEASSGDTKYNTYLAVFKINYYNFMKISVPTTAADRAAYSLATVTLCTDGGFDAMFNVDFEEFYYHVDGTKDADGNTVSYLYYEESDIK